MDMETIFDLWYYIGCGVILNGLRCAVEADFLARFLRVRLKPALFLLYIAASLLVSFSLGAYRIPLWIYFCAHFALMFAAGAALPGGFFAAPAAALAPCMIAATQFALADGLSASILSALMFVVVRTRMVWNPLLGFVVPLAVPLAMLAPSYCFLKYLAERQRRLNADTSYLHLLLLPCLLIVLVMHFNWNLWEMETTITLDPNAPADYARAWREAILLLCAFLAFTAVLAAFFKMSEAAERDAETSNLEQQIKIQRQYVAEARRRNEQYRAFHHDIANHFSVLSGLLATEDGAAEAAKYLRKIKDNADTAVGLISTGSVVLDVLLGEKIAYARRQGIAVTWETRLDRRLGADDFDLCVLFANAMDNAIRACADAGEAADIHIVSKIKNNFLFIEIENACAPQTRVVWGVGLRNMRRTAEKYHGAVNAAAEGGRFRLSVLLCLSAERED